MTNESVDKKIKEENERNAMDTIEELKQNEDLARFVAELIEQENF